MSSELEEIGEYVLRILEKMKETESRVQKLEDSVNSIGKVIEEATEEVQTEDNAPTAAPSISFRLWAPLNAVKWVGVCLAIFSIANIRGRMSIATWNGVIPSNFPFWNMIDGILAGVSLAAVAGIEVFFFWRERRRKRPLPTVLEVEETKQVQESEESAKTPLETEEILIDEEEIKEMPLESPSIEETE